MKIKSFLPHAIALVIFAALSFAYFYPVIEGKVLKANDATVAKINAKEIQDFRDKYGSEPLWTNSLFSGMPAYLISTIYPGNLFKHVDSALRIFGMPVSVVFLAMAGFYILLLMFGVNPWLAIAGAVAYGFSSFLFQIISAGHNTQAIAFAYMAPMIGGIYYSYRHDAIRGALFTALILALELLANHPQMTYYGLMIVLIFIITEFIYSLKEKTFLKFFKTSALLIVPFIIAIGINFGFLYTTYEYGKYSQRGKSDLKTESENITSGLDRDYIVGWSYGIGETMNLLIPNFKGGSSHPFDRDSETVKFLRKNNAMSAADSFQKYWGTQPGTEGPHYMGAIVIFLFVLGLILLKGRDKWWLLIATVLSIMLAWGKNFMPLTNLFIDYFPGYNKFRSVTFILIIAQFCIPLLGFLALKEVYYSEAPGKKLIKGLLLALSITGGIILIFLLIPALAGSFLNDYESSMPPALINVLIADRKELLKSDSFRSLIFIVLASGAILGFLYGKIKKEYSLIALGVLILLDLWTVDKRYLNSDKFVKPAVMQKSFSPTFADREIMKDTTFYRVCNFTVSTFQDNSPTAYFHNSIGGYHGAKLKRYKELIDSSLARDIYYFDSTARSVQSLEALVPVFKKTTTLNMLNTKYIIYRTDSPPLENPDALGNAWFVEKPVFVENANDELKMLNEISTDNTAVIDIHFKDQVAGSAYPVAENDTIALKSHRSNELVYKYSAAGERLVLFSEIYYPAGWRCYLDGQESKYFRADFVLRAMVVPPGEHEIKFVFKPSSYITGNKVSMASSILLIIMLGGYLAMSLLKKRAF